MTSGTKRTIQGDNPQIAKLESLIALGVALPKDSEPNRLAQQISSLPSLPDRFNGVFLQHGWIYVEFACGCQPAEDALEMHSKGFDQVAIDEFLARNFLAIEPIKWQSLKLLGGGMNEPRYPIRAQIIERVFEAFGINDYLVVVPLVLILVDGFGVSVTGSKSMFTDLKALEEMFQSTDSVAGHPSALRALLRYLCKGQGGYSETALTMPFRNGVLHGSRLNYANAVVAAKALNLLAAVVEWGRDVAPEPRSTVEKRDWNVKFLQSNLSRLNPTSPEEALELFKSALASHQVNDLVALIDYHPVLTLLSEKLCEWRELDATEIEINRLSEWQVFGNSNDSEQQAKCQIQLRVKAPNGIQVNVERTLYAMRSVELANAGLPSVWQIGLNLLGAIRYQLKPAD